MTVNSKAWLEGRVAGLAGAPAHTNPYRGGVDFQSWFEGWRNGQTSQDHEVHNNA